MSIGRTVRRFARQGFDVVRRGGFYDGNGIFRRSIEPQFAARGNVQVASPRDIQQLPEGSRVQGAIAIWGCFRVDTGASVELRATGLDDSGAEKMGDRVLYGDTEYEVTAISSWARHAKYICTRAQQ